MAAYTTPHPDRAALLTIDVQNDFTRAGAPAEIEGTRDVIEPITRLLAAFRDAEAPIVHVVRLYRRDGSNVDACRRAAIEDGAEIVRPGTAGADIVDELTPDPDVTLEADRLLAGEFQPLGPVEWAMYKPRWSAFYRTDLAAFLTDRGLDTVVVCGCNFPNCPRSTIYDATQRDLRVVFVPDATSGVSPRGREELAAIGVRVRETDETVEWLTG